jgi:hypothetical protein
MQLTTEVTEYTEKLVLFYEIKFSISHCRFYIRNKSNHIKNNLCALCGLCGFLNAIFGLKSFFGLHGFFEGIGDRFTLH